MTLDVARSEVNICVTTGRAVLKTSALLLHRWRPCSLRVTACGKQAGMAAVRGEWSSTVSRLISFWGYQQHWQQQLR